MAPQEYFRSKKIYVRLYCSDKTYLAGCAFNVSLLWSGRCVKGGKKHGAWGGNCGIRIAECGLKSSMLDAGYSMLDKDLLLTDPPPAENLTPET